MLIDHRAYTLKPGTMKLQLALFEEFGMPYLRKYVGEPLAILSPLASDINTYVHIWCYDSYDDRARRRGAMESDPGWAVYVGKVRECGYVVKQHSWFMTPVAFAEVKRPFAPPFPPPG